jgi:hypothetical protein
MWSWAVLVFFTPVSFCFSPRIKLPFKSVAALSIKKKLNLETSLELCTEEQLKFLDGKFNIQTPNAAHYPWSAGPS